MHVNVSRHATLTVKRAQKTGAGEEPRAPCVGSERGEPMSKHETAGKNDAGTRGEQPHFTRGTQATIRAHGRVIANAPAEEFHISTRLCDDPAGDGLTHYPVQAQTARILSSKDVFKRVRRVRFERRSNPGVVLWRCPRKFRERAQQLVENWDSPIGCGHTGIRNVRDGGFTCTTDDCDREVERGEVER
jgi:hypothetical protein